MHPLESMNVARYTKQSLADEIEANKNKSELSSSIKNAPQVNFSMANDVNTVVLSQTDEPVAIPWNQRRNPIVGRQFDVYNKADSTLPNTGQPTTKNKKEGTAIYAKQTSLCVPKANA